MGRWLFPIYGEVPAEGGGWGRVRRYLRSSHSWGGVAFPPHSWGGGSSPFMGKYPPKAGDGAGPVPTSPVLPIYGEVSLFLPIHGEVARRAGGTGDGGAA